MYVPRFLGTSPNRSEAFVSVRQESLSICLVTAMPLLWLWLTSYVVHAEDFWPGWSLPLFLLVATGLAFVIRRRSFLASSGIFAAGLFVGALGALTWSANADIALILFVTVVLVVGVLHGSRTALFTAGSAILAILVSGPLAGVSLDRPFSMSIVFLVGLTGLISWITTRNLSTSIDWALMYSEQAVRSLEEARTYQGKLASALSQLEEANYRLERANHALEWARAEADHARQSKAQFAAHVSHELRTPINLIVGFSDLMLNHPDAYASTPLERTYLADLTALYRSAKHLQGLIDDILDLSQLDAGEMPIIKDITEIGAVIHEAVAIARPLLDRKHLSLSVDVASNLPLLQIDRLRIRQVLLNLLNNASRFTDRGGVGVRAFRELDEVIIEVTDTGVGIRAADLPRLFEPYQQMSQSDYSDDRGTGLGLVIAKRFVESHGGRIWANSEGIPGRGSTFAFSLPVRTADTSSFDMLQSARHARWVARGRPPPPSVVILDDDPTVVGFFRRRLVGYHVVGADSEDRAVELGRKLKAQVVIVPLPEEGKWDEWYRRWCSTAADSKLRFIGCPKPSDRRIAQTIGLADYLVKPVTRDALLSAVQSVLPSVQTILVVDDEPRMTRLLTRMLRSSPTHYRLLRAHSGQQAIDVMKRARPDLVLLDLMMPEINGLTVLEEMRRTEELRSVPVIAVSARGMGEILSPTPRGTIVFVADRTFSVSELLGTVQAVLDALPPAEAE